MTVLARNSRILWRRNGDRVILRDREGDATYVLEGSGAMVWSALDSPTDEAELIADLARRVGVSEDEVARDLAPFVSGLRARSLLVAVDR